jgi:endonuclease/exonuclease/phosphatase family metal-dependent hydrolase
MATRFRIFTRRVFITINVVVVFFFLLSCLVPWLHPQKWWVISFLGLAFPILLFLVILFLVGWLLLWKPKRALISAVALLLSFKNLSVFLAFHPSTTFKEQKEPGVLRVATWNVARFLELKKNTNKGSQTRLKMFELLRQQNADVLCLQEFHTSVDTNYYNNIIPIQKELGYPYFFFSFDEDGDDHYYSSIIFSRYPFADTGRIRYPRPSLPEVLIYADIKFNKDTVRVYTTHLQSLQFGIKDYKRIGKITSGEDSLIENSRNILGKIKRGFSRRAIQADVVREVMSVSPHPFLLCADLNDVPNSYTYFTVRGKMQDAFLKKGFGIGRTFTGLSPTLRIDYILADPNFRIRQFKRVTKKLSDHYMLVADVQLKPAKKN